MSTPPSFRSTQRATLSPALRTALKNCGEGRCCLVVLSASNPDEGGEVLELDCHPCDWLFGLDLADCAGGLAVITPGTVVGSDWHGVDESAQVLVVATVYQDGQSSLHLFRNGAAELLAPNAHGLVPDSMRRALGLATTEPLLNAGWYWAERWLEEIRRDGLHASPELLGLEDVICAHPVIEACELDDHTWVGLHEFCRGRHAEHSWLTGWGGIRQMLGNPSGVPNSDSEMQELAAARWFDDGSFSRWYVNRQPQLRDVFESVSVFLDSAATALVRGVIDDALDEVLG